MSLTPCMPSWPNRAMATGAVAALGIAYPFAVYFSLGRIPAGALVLTALVLVGARMLLVRGQAVGRVLLLPLAAMAATVAGLGALAPEVAAKTYPVLMSLAFAAAFALSLRHPPSLVELFARLGEPDPSPRAVAYMRRVSAVWAVFLLGNAAVSLATALWADLALWTLYNGLVAYLLMGALFAGEWLVRRRVRA